MMMIRMMMVTVVIVSLVCMVAPPVMSEILYGETAPMSFEVWAADLKQGFILKEKTIDDRLCYCKKPQSSSSSSSSSIGSFDLNKPPILTSSGVPASSFEFIFLTPPYTKNAPADVQETNATIVALKTIVCGLCDMEVTFDDTTVSNVYKWSSPNWENNQDYPDGCTCTLTVHVRLSSYGYFAYDFAPGSSIKAFNNCAHDRLEANLNGETKTWCDNDMSQWSGGQYTAAEDEDFTFTFISDPSDGNLVAKGFEMIIMVMNLGQI